MAKLLSFSDESRSSLERGVDALADAVRVTIGPRGRNVVLEKKFGAPDIVNDGDTIAREIELDDPFENLGAKLIQQVASRTKEKAGDGTTTATVLAQAMVREGLRNTAAGASPVELRRGMEQAVSHVVRGLTERSQQVAGDAIRQVATVSSGGDAEVGRMISEAMDRVSVDGVITVEDGTAAGPFDVIIGADGVRSRVARNKPTYLGYVVALGIAPGTAVPPHLRRATWQCLDGVANRMYSMPFDGLTDASTDPADDVSATSDVEPRVMWQFSWREADEGAARVLAKAGGFTIRETVQERCRDWASYVPHLVSETAPEDIVAYALVDVDAVRCVVDDRTVLIGDAAHAMSPFKGQGANQALVDGVELARRLYRVPSLRPIEAPPPPRGALSVEEALLDFERECIMRVTNKLNMSRANAQLTHSISALAVGDVPRAEAARAALSGALCF